MTSQRIILLLVSAILAPAACVQAAVLQTSARVRIMPCVEIERLDTPTPFSSSLPGDAMSSTTTFRVTGPPDHAFDVKLTASSTTKTAGTALKSAVILHRADGEFLVCLEDSPGPCHLFIAYE